MGAASLSDGKKVLKLPLPPESIKWAIAGSYATNNILDTSNPTVRRKFSASTFKLDRILLVSNAFLVDQYPTINTLTFWAKKQTKLKFTFNTYTIPVCYISSIDVEVFQWRKNRPVHAEVNIELMEALPEPKKVVKTDPKKITDREQVKKKTTVQNRLKTPAKLQALGLSQDYAVEVNELASVKFTDGDVTKEYDYDEFMELTT